MVLPTCPENYFFNKKTCRCNKTIKKPAKKPAKKLTKKPAKKTIKAPVNKIEKPIVKKSRRCPNGTRKNKKTNNCEKINSKNIPKQKKELIKIKSEAVQQDLAISDAFKSIPPADLDKLLVEFQDDPDKNSDKLFSTVRSQLVKSKSFSPAVNKQLISLRPGKHSDFFGCGLSIKNLNTNNFKIKIGSKKAGGKETPICVTSTSKKAQNLFLNNLKHLQTIDCNNIIAPLQKKSNCWFNTMFMAFFISDKGRKFFRFFRQLMIEGKQASLPGEKGQLIKPAKLRQAFFLLNACIEASYNISDSKYKNEALLMDTNTVIKLIYDSIPKKYIKRYSWIKDVNDAGNPFHYYDNIIRYLGINSLYAEKNFTQNDIVNLFTSPNIQNVRIGWGSNPLFSVDKKTNKFIGAPDICVFTLHEDTSNITKPLQFEVTSNVEKITYALDSIVIRNTKKEHFCCVLTCNKKEKSFDGASVGRLKDFNWKSKINENIDWTFEYQGDYDHYSTMRWNFTNCYQLMFYYRIN